MQVDKIYSKEFEELVREFDNNGTKTLLVKKHYVL